MERRAICFAGCLFVRAGPFFFFFFILLYNLKLSGLSCLMFLGFPWWVAVVRSWVAGAALGAAQAHRERHWGAARGLCCTALLAAECWLLSETLGPLPGRGGLMRFSRHKLQCHFPALLTLSISTQSTWYELATSLACPICCISCPSQLLPLGHLSQVPLPCPTSLSLFTLPGSVLPSLAPSSNPSSASGQLPEPRGGSPASCLGFAQLLIGTVKSMCLM